MRPVLPILFCLAAFSEACFSGQNDAPEAMYSCGADVAKAQWSHAEFTPSDISDAALGACWPQLTAAVKAQYREVWAAG